MHTWASCGQLARLLDVALSDVVTARTLKAAPETSEDSMLGRLAAVF